MELSGTAAEAMRGLAERWVPLVAAEAKGKAGAKPAGSGEGEESSGDGCGGGDFVCSPAGLWLALTAVAAGARGETAEELRRLLGAAGPDAARAVTEVGRALAGEDALGVATRVWSKVPVYRAYREALPDVGFGPLAPEGPGDPGGQEEVDAWVREATGGLIDRLPVELTPDMLLVLVNALALKARWEVPFEGAATRDADFVDGAGVRHRVPTMHRTVPVGDAWSVDGGRATVVELRCAGASSVRVRLVLGAVGAGAEEVLPLGWAAGPERCASLDADVVALALPRFVLRRRVDVTEQLGELGAGAVLGARADFSLMSPERLAVSEVVQEAVVRVGEAGVEAAAVTAVPMAPGAAPPVRRVERVAFERPFGVVVVVGDEGEVGVPLFVGWQGSVPRG
ncbi:serpin family protein [Actinomycetota bacterium Odt1-20B]